MRCLFSCAQGLLMFVSLLESASGLLAGRPDGSQEEPEESLTLREVFSSKEASVRRGLKVSFFRSQAVQETSSKIFADHSLQPAVPASFRRVDSCLSLRVSLTLRCAGINAGPSPALAHW